MKTGSPSQPILSAPGATRLVVGNWSLFCKRDGEISIHNSDGQQVSEYNFLIPFTTSILIVKILPVTTEIYFL